MARRNVLNEEQKRFVVQSLAHFFTPSEVVSAVSDHYGVEVTRQNIQQFDPTKYAGRKLAKKWRDLFEQSREECLKDLETIPHANKPFRVRKLAKAADAFEQRGNYVAMADIYERIAKEVGNVHTNRREHTGKNGGPIETKDVSDMSDDELNTTLANKLSHLLRPVLSDDQ